MPLNVLNVSVAQARGVSAVCSRCVHYHEARDAGIEGDACTRAGLCGSPLVGDCFSHYEGPITDMRSLCFVCGGPPKYGIRSGNLIRQIGVCEAHIGIVHTHRARGRENIPVRMEGAPPPPPPAYLPRQNLMDTIMEVEEEDGTADQIREYEERKEEYNHKHKPQE